MRNLANSSSYLRKEDWLKNCEKNLNGIAYDVISSNTRLLNFCASKTVIIPPVADYEKIRKKNGNALETDGDKKGNDAEILVSKHFERLGPGGIYVSNLNILELIRSHGEKTSLKHFLPDDNKICSYLTNNADIEIDGIFIHPRIGLAIIEIKSVENSNQKSKNCQNQLPKIICGESGVKAQLNRYETFLKEFFSIIFEKEIPFPVFKIACAPNVDMRPSTVTDKIYLLDKKVFKGNDGNFQLFWNQIMIPEDETLTKDFIQFAAVLISLKTAFGLVSTFTSNIISASYDFLREHKSVLYDSARKQSAQIKQRNKVVYFWLNCEQLNLYESDPGKHFAMGPPGSGKSLLIKVRILKFGERRAQIYCPQSLTFQYQQFVNENGLEGKVEVYNFSVLTEIAKILRKCLRDKTNFHKSIYGCFLSPDIDIYCDEMNNSTYNTENVHQLFELRPAEVDTFIVGESPDVEFYPIKALSKAFNGINFKVTSLKTTMRSSIEIIQYFLSLNKNTTREDIKAGHSLQFFEVREIPCKDQSEVVKQIITLIETKREHYERSDIAIITLSDQVDDIVNSLQQRNISTKKLEDDASVNAVTILTPKESKSYEWKMVIVWMNYDHEGELPLAVTRAIMELIIIKEQEFQNAMQNLRQWNPYEICEHAELEYQNEITQLEDTSISSFQNTQYEPLSDKNGDTISIPRETDEIWRKHTAPSQNEAFIWYKKAAEQGNIQAQFNLALQYAKGEGVLQSTKNAFKWFRKAAEQDNAIAQFYIGLMYDEGRGVQQSEKEAIEWYKKAAEQGLASAQFNLGLAHYSKQNNLLSYEEAVKWFTKAAVQGHTTAQFCLGMMNYIGQGVPKSHKEALKWYKKAAKKGFAIAQLHLALMHNNKEDILISDAKDSLNYTDATEVQRDGERNHIKPKRKKHFALQSNEESIKWCKKAALQGLASAEFNLGLFHDNEQGDSKSDKEASIWYRRAAEQGNISAQNNLGVIFSKGKGVSQSNEEAIKWYSKAADEGNACAQYNIGLMYESGQGFPVSREEAYNWYKKAGEKGLTKAQNKIGFMYCNGQGVLQSDEEAIKWYLKAAELGDATGQKHLGFLCRNGRGVPQSDEEAAKWYRKAAEQGDAQAQFNLGVMYKNGQGVPQSDEDAVKWYIKAAEQGNISAQNNLGVVYENGQSISQSYEEAVKWFRKAAEQGDITGQRNLGFMFRNGRGVSQSDEEAVKWFRKAAEQGDATGQSILGFAYEKGRGVSQSDKKAVKWYRKAAEQGHTRGQCCLGFMYAKGRGMPLSIEKALEWYRKAATHGDAIAQLNLGLAYQKGQGVPQSDEEAVKWFKNAADQGHTRGQCCLGFLYTKGRGVPQSYEEALIWYRKAAEHGDATGQSSLGLMYAYGRGVPQSDKEAVKWYRNAAEQGHARGQCSLGFMYAKGRGVPQSYEEAVKWYGKAAKLGDAIAQFNAGLAYEKGQGVPQSDEEAVKWYIRAAEQYAATSKNDLEAMLRSVHGMPLSKVKAVKWFRKAAEQGDAEGQRNLGVMYQNGRGVPQSYEEAAKWYNRAAEQGNSKAQLYLGLMHENGQGMPQSDKEAVKWYRKAAEQGDSRAQIYLGLMQENGQGMVRSNDEAVKWYRRAATQGDTRGKMILTLKNLNW